MTKKLIANG